MTRIPMYKWMQGPPSKTISDADRHALYEHYGITHGTPGSVSEDQARDKLNEILQSNMSRDMKLDALDALHPYIVNNVEFGGVSNVLEEADRAFEKVMYSEDE